MRDFDEMRLDDEGSPDDDGEAPVSPLLHVLPFKKRPARLSRRTRNLIHLSMFVALAVVLYVDGPKPADLAFLGLSLVSEVLP